MRNFTLGKRGLSMLFFAFFLLIGNSPTFAQSENCPTVSNTNPDDFCYLSTIADLTNETGAQGNGDGLRWYRTQTSNNPIPNDELLTTGTYWAGNNSNTCREGRIAVSVTVDDFGAPTTQFGNTFAPCEYDEADVSTVQDLIDNVDGNEVEIFDAEFGETALNPATRLIEGNSYFAGQRNPDTNCRTSRIALRYDPVLALAPAGEAVQQFCVGATVADLEATFTSADGQAIRWYSTLTSSPALASTTPLVDGENYFASQIVNRSNSNLPPCESTDRFEVRVELIEAEEGEPQVGVVCTTEVEEIFPSVDAVENFLRDLLDPSAPSGGTFSPTAAQLVDEYQNTPEPQTGDFTTTYSVGDEGCEYTVELTIRIIESQDANAGTIEDIVVDCDDESIVILDDSLLSEDATTGGTFTGEGVNDEGNFDPAIGPGEYTITYSVNDEQDCVIEGTEDETTFTITVQGAEEFRDPIVLEMCITEVQDAINSPADFEDFFNNILEENGITNFDGTFDPSENVVGTEIFAYINSEPTEPGIFNTTYTVTTDCGEESVDITLTINNLEDPEAGPINPAPVCASETPFDLFSLLGEDNDMGGTFSDENGVIENGLFDVSEMGTFPITYSVSESTENCTSGEPDSTDFTLTVNEGTVAESPAPVFVCDADVQTIFPSNDEIRKFYLSIAQQAGFPTNGTFNPTARQIAAEYQASNGLGDFTTTYTFGEGDCRTSVDLTVTIVEDADAGEDGSVTLTPEDDAVNLFDFLGGTPMEGGSWSNGDGMFDPATDEEGVFTYTVTLGSCEDSATVTVTVEDETDPTIPTEPGCAGEDVDIVICESQVNFFLDNPEEAMLFFENILSPNVDQSGTFDPSLESIMDQWRQNPVGTFTTTYTLDTEDCDDSAQITIVVTEGDQIMRDPVVAIVCESDVQTLFPSNDEIRKFYINMLPNDIPRGGTLNPTAAQIAQMYQNDEDGLGDFTSTYTVEDGQCTVSIELTVRVVAEEEATTGEIADAEVCNSEETINLFDLLDPEDNTPGGTFSNENGVITNGILDISVPGEYEITYTVSGEDATTCISGTASTNFMVTSVDGEANAGPGATLEFCITEIEAMTPQEALAIFNNLLPEDIDQDGVFSPTIETLIAQFMANPIGTFATEYTVGEGPCQATAEYVIIINDLEEANAGSDSTVTFCATQGAVNLLDFLNEDANQNGNFEELEDNMFNPSEAGIGTYTFTYTVDSSADCVIGEDSATYTIEVVPSTVDAGQDNSMEVCLADVDAFGATQVRNLFLNLLDDEVSRDGTFSPTIAEIITQYNTVSKVGDFTTTYTVSENGCEDSVELTITVIQPNDAGADMALTFCSTQGPIDLFDFLSSNATLEGTFEGYEDGIFDPSTATIGVTTITYTVEEDDNVCTTGNFTSTLTITVVEPQDANAGGDVAVTFCVDQDENIDLTSILGEDAIMLGSFSAPYANGIFNPATAGLGEYVITYSIDGEEDCAIGSDSATITITVAEAVAEAPVADANQFFCLGDNATVADLVATGNNVVWYSDAALENVANASTPLANGAVFYAVSSGETACETSESVMVTVTLQDSMSPTLPNLGNEFCRQDNPTVQDLIDNFSGSNVRIYSSVTGGTPLAVTTAIQNEVTYYATATDDSLCESTERVAVNARVRFCGIPEGFSPNGDNINDRFVIPDIRRDYPNFSIEIFNRWGNVVYKGNASMPDWDGVSNQSSTLGDNVLPAGVYFYILNYNDGTTSPVQGKLYLSR